MKPSLYENLGNKGLRVETNLKEWIYWHRMTFIKSLPSMGMPSTVFPFSMPKVLDAFHSI